MFPNVEEAMVNGTAMAYNKRQNVQCSFLILQLCLLVLHILAELAKLDSTIMIIHGVKRMGGETRAATTRVVNETMKQSV